MSARTRCINDWPSPCEWEDFSWLATPPIFVTLCMHLPPSTRHLANSARTSGGLGLTGGIADVGALYDALVGIHKGVADEQILTEYSEARSAKYREYVDPLSTANFRRLWEKDPETTVAEDGFFQMVREAQADPDVAKKMLEVRSSHDSFAYWGKWADLV